MGVYSSTVLKIKKELQKKTAMGFSRTFIAHRLIMSPGSRCIKIKAKEFRIISCNFNQPMMIML